MRNMRHGEALGSPDWRLPPGRVFVVLPAYNEAEGLGDLIRRIDGALFHEGVEYQVIVVDDGSTDSTAEVAKDYAAAIPLHLERHEVNQGLGATIRDGLRVAAELCSDRDIVIAMDADNTHTPGLMRSMVRRVHEGNDVVIASRYQRGSNVRGLPLHRRFLSWAASILLRTLFPIRGVRDYTCSFRAYRGEVLKEAFRRYGDEFVSQGGFQCMVDILLKLRTMDLIFREVPLILRYDYKLGASKMPIWATIRRTLLLVLRRRLGG